PIRKIPFPYFFFSPSTILDILRKFKFSAKLKVFRFMYRPFALLFLLVALGSQFPASSQTSSRLIEKTISRVDTQAAFQFQESSEYQYSDGRGSDMKTHAYHFDTSWTESDQRGNYTQRA